MSSANNPEEQFSESDWKLIKNAQKRIDTAYENLYDLVNFPPFRTTASGLGDYIQELITAHIKLRNTDKMDLMFGEYQLFTDFKNKYAEVIKEALSYKNKTNDNNNLAFELYYKKNNLPYVSGQRAMPRQAPWE